MSRSTSVVRHNSWTSLVAVLALAIVITLAPSNVRQAQSGSTLKTSLTGTYLETRTCQVYTGPCFASGESGLAGKSAIMAWNIESGIQDGVELSGTSVVLVTKASTTIGFQGLHDAKDLKSVILVDASATQPQRDALVRFARRHAGPAGRDIRRVDVVPIDMNLDVSTLRGSVKAGKQVAIATRKAPADDCICGNESAYYPPLVGLENFAAGISIENRFSGRGLGLRWNAPDSRSAYMATFAY